MTETIAEDVNILSSRIRQSRKALGWTQKDLAKIVGVPEPVISRLENRLAENTLLVLRKALTDRVVESLGDDAPDFDGDAAAALCDIKVVAL
jgi:transcriptional regulator with XRE-family HTH domain